MNDPNTIEPGTIIYNKSPNVQVADDEGNLHRANLVAVATGEIRFNDPDNSPNVEVADEDGVFHRAQLVAMIGSGGGGGEVTSVNGKKGHVVLDANDVNAVPQYETMPTASESNVGKIVHYSGETIPDVPATAVATQTVGSGLSDLSVNVETFIEVEQPSGAETVAFTANVIPSDMTFTSVPEGVTITVTNADSFVNWIRSTDHDPNDYTNALLHDNGAGFWSVALDSSMSGIITGMDAADWANYGIVITGSPIDNYDAYYELTIGQTTWSKNCTTVDVADYGISYTGTPADGDTISVAYTPFVAGIINGYFYKSSVEYTDPTATISQTAGQTDSMSFNTTVGNTEISGTAQNFRNLLAIYGYDWPLTSGVAGFGFYNGNWSIGITDDSGFGNSFGTLTETLILAGFSVSGEPTDGDAIDCSYVFGLNNLSINVDTFIEAEQPTQDETVDFTAIVTSDSVVYDPDKVSDPNSYLMTRISEMIGTENVYIVINVVDENNVATEIQAFNQLGGFFTITEQDLVDNNVVISNVSVGDTIYLTFVQGTTTWAKNGETVDIAVYGISYSGTPVDGDTLTVAYTAPTPIGYSWKQTDVQPSSGGGNAGIEWKTKIDLPAEYYGDEYSARPYYTISGGLPDGEYEFYFSTKTTTEGSNVPFGEVIYKVIMKIDNTNHNAYGRIGYVFNGDYLNDGNTVYGTGFTFWSLVLGNNGDIVLFNTEKPWASAILGYNSHQAVPECFKLSAIKNVSTGDEYIATGGINLDGSWPSYDTSYDGQFTLYAIANQPDIPHYKINTSFTFDDSQQYIYVGQNISHGSVVSNCSELDVSLVSSNGGKWHCIVENARDGYVARVIQATGDLSNTQIGWNADDGNTFIFLNTTSGTSGNIYASFGIKGAEYGISVYTMTPGSFTSAVITKPGSDITKDNLGLIEQYTGATDATYTNGYFYKANGTEVIVPESISPSNYSQPDWTAGVTDLGDLISAISSYSGWGQDYIRDAFARSNYWRFSIETGAGSTMITYADFDFWSTDAPDILQHLTVTYDGEAPEGFVTLEFTPNYTPTETQIQNPQWEQVDVQPVPEVIKVNTTATLAVADWSSSTQTVTVSGVKADSVVFVSPAPASASDYASAGILCTAQATDSLTFTCTTTPSNAITVNVVCM